MAKQSGKTIVVTGMTRGLGLAMVEQFVNLGHRVIGCGRTKNVIRDISQKLGPEHFISDVDITNDKVVQKWAEEALSRFGAPDILVNNAAVINPSKPLWGVSAEEFDQVLAVNLTGMANVIRHFVPPMLKLKKGLIVNFSSGWGRSTSPEVAPYCCSKWGVEGLTQALAQELPTGMAAIPLNPGIIDTEMLRSCFGGDASNYPSPSQWAKKAVPFILSIGPQHNGQSLTVN